MRIFHNADELRAAAGEELGASDWLVIEQDRINLFADATDDHQWIHVDEKRAADGPYGATIAHGYLTLSLLSRFFFEIYSVEGAKSIINYGLNKVRFIAPVRVGSKVRGSARLDSVTDVKGGVQAVFTAMIGIDASIDTNFDGEEKPAVVAESIARFIF